MNQIPNNINLERLKRYMRFYAFPLIGILFLFTESCFNNRNVSTSFPVILQQEAADCGPVCLKMIGGYHGLNWELENIKQYAQADASGTSLLGLKNTVDSLGGEGIGAKVKYDFLRYECPLPAILHWDYHYVVIYEVSHDSAWIADPAIGLVSYSKNDLCKLWYEKELDSKEGGVILIIDPKK